MVAIRHQVGIMRVIKHREPSIPNVNIHIKNVLDEGELQPEATIKEDLIVRLEGKRQVKRAVKLYNLDMILAVGYPPAALTRSFGSCQR